ncbi:hypothetical protein DRO56_02670 [Candidatus Bathyarchaeota archaeon]|nr:protease complex subunit PrcB family protein [Candidatus Bathyarchaeota archaeon]RLI32950.1 MAG: hypothetical protein DRO56_02670 [Candidatus Bathyarchaeota archaeon]
MDFSNTTIIAVFMGEFSTGGYEIEIKEVIDVGSSILVKVEKTYPGRGCTTTEAFSQPYHIIKLQKIEKPVTFRTSVKVRICD